MKMFADIKGAVKLRATGVHNTRDLRYKKISS